MTFVRCLRASCLVALACAASLRGQAWQGFETPQVKGLALTSDGLRLVAVHASAGTLAVFSLARAAEPRRIASIDVGLEPCSVRLRTDREAWVVNRLSDSISIVDLEQQRVLTTIATEDEPADVVFAGTPERAFVTSSGRDLVQVFDVRTRREVARVPIFGQEPRALAVDPTGKRVFVVVHQSGNGTTILSERFAPPQPKPTRKDLPDGPQVPLIVEASDPRYATKHGIVLPDIDLVELDADTLVIRREIAGVGTSNFGIAVDPSGKSLWIANTDAKNLLRFEHALRGRFVHNRVTRVDLESKARVLPIDLNPGVDYDKLPNAAAKSSALAQATDLCFSPGGDTLWLTAFGTDRVARIDKNGTVLDRVEVGGTPGTRVDPRRKRGPRSLEHHPSMGLLYVVGHLSGTLIVVDTRARQVVSEVSLGVDPTPLVQREGRGFLYDAKLSGNGLVSCASCHVDGRRDGLAWDLGDPAGQLRVLVRDREPFVTFELHPMKGPLVTQTLIGLAGQEPYHWRGDRASLADFNATFDTILGGSELGAEDLDRFIKFLLSLRFPPNPNQERDRSYSTKPAGASAADGFAFFKSANFSGATPAVTCVSCHARPSGSSDEIVIGRETAQYMITQPLRDLYLRTGKRAVNGRSKTGFGLLHAGQEAGVFEFLGSDLPFLGKLRHEAENKRMLERFLMEFDTGTAPVVGSSLRLTLQNLRAKTSTDELAFFAAQAKAKNCGLVARLQVLPSLLGPRGPRGLAAEPPRDFVWDAVEERFATDRMGERKLRWDELLSLVDARHELTIRGVPPGLEGALGNDRDRDGVLDGDARPQPYGLSSPRCAPELLLQANAVLRLEADDFALVVRPLSRGARGILAISAAPASLRFDGVTFLVDPTQAIVLWLEAGADGAAIATLGLGQDQSLVGRRFYAQALFPVACGQTPFGASNGLVIPVLAARR